MSFITWDEKVYSVQNMEIDEQHKRLIGYINELYEAMKVGKARFVLDEIFDGLVDYTKTHFAIEEGLMQRNHYPAYAIHKLEHDKLTAQVLELQKKVQPGQTKITLDTLQFLKDWLFNHILMTDKKLGAFLKGK